MNDSIGTRSKHMSLTAFLLAAGFHRDSWRIPGSRSEEIGYLDLVTDMARMCEDAKLDAVFFGDIITAEPLLRGDIMLTGLYEPVTTLAALAGRTEKIGLIGTISTSFSLPFVVARQLSGLDSLSGGRAGWNIVTSGSGNENFGLEEMPHPNDRYRQATEYVEVVTALWDSWSDDAVINDRQSGWWADPAKIQVIDHEGEFYKVKGPLNMRRSPQGRPVMVQAGSSGPGIELGSSVADGIYTAQPIKEKSIEYYAQLKGKASAKGRKPESIRILAGILPILGETQAEAEELADELTKAINPVRGRNQVESYLGIDLSDIGLDETIPLERLVDDERKGSRYMIWRGYVEQGWTLQQLIVETARAGGHSWVVGTPGKVADHMIDWFESRACDGFSLNPANIPTSLQRICTQLVPELQERGYFREEYEGSTLREHFGLDRPGAWDTRA